MCDEFCLSKDVHYTGGKREQAHLRFLELSKTGKSEYGAP